MNDRKKENGELELVSSKKSAKCRRIARRIMRIAVLFVIALAIFISMKIAGNENRRRAVSEFFGEPDSHKTEEVGGCAK